MTGRPRRRFCKRCGGPVEVVGKLSARGKCSMCGIGRMALNAQQLHEHSGDFFQHWRRRCLAAFGVVTDTDE